MESRSVYISRRLYETRLNQGISMAALARVLGCSVSQLERMETGRASLSAAALVEWVLALNLDLVVQPRKGWPGSDAVTPDSADARLLEAFRTAAPRTREAVSVMLALDRPAPPPVRLTRAGRPPGPSRAAAPLALTLAQINQLRRSPVPFTGNRVLTALKLADGTITQLAHQARLRYSRVTRIVNGKAREVPAAYAAEIAACFGCLVQDLFPQTALLQGAPDALTTREPDALAAV
ncbi:MAG: helix-turn-helix domain-containing protein [Vicinamibacterales bacterium]